MHNAIRAFSIFSALFLTTLPLLAQAPPCRPGTMANVVGTSCSVGQLTFNFKDDFFGSSFVETNGSTVFTPVPPAGVGFIPVSAGSQVGFKLVFNFVDNPRGADNTSAADHFIQFSYSSQSAPQTEIRAQSISMEAAAQNAPGNFVFVNVGDFQIYPNNPIAVVNDPSIDIENGVTIFNQLTSNQFLEIPGTQSTGNFLGTKTTQIFDEATGFASASLTSATFLFTSEPVVPTPPPASLSYSTIDLPGVAATFVSNITNSGRTVGSYLDAAGIFHAYVAEPDGTFSTIDVPGSTSTVGFSLNEHGDVAGDYTDPAGGTHGFFQHDGVITTFDFPNSLQTEVGAINNKGQIDGEYQSADGGFHGFLLDKGVFTTIDHGPGTGLFASTGAFGINDAGEIAGFFFDPNSLRGFIQKGSSFQPIDVPSQGDTIIESINNPGDAVGFYNVVFGPRGFLLSQGKFFSVDFPGGNLNFPTGINASGKIVGQYNDANGAAHSYLAIPVSGDGQSHQPTPQSTQKLSCSGDDWQMRHARRILAPCQVKH
jgi:uncharacterized membrane protein